MTATEYKKIYHRGNLREALISSALEVIRERGVESVTMRGLSKIIGVSRTAAYRYFENKRDLLYAVAEEGFRTLERINRELAARVEADALETLEAFGQAYLGFALENPRLYRLMFGPELIGQERPGPVVAVTDQAFGHLMAVFGRGQEQGRIRAGSVFAMAGVMWSNMHGLASLLIDGQLPAYARDHGAAHLPPDVTARPREVASLVMDLAMDVLVRGVAAAPRGPAGQ